MLYRSFRTAVLCLSVAVSLSAQTYQGGSLIVNGHGSASSAASTSMTATQEKGAAFFPQIMIPTTDANIANPALWRVTYVASFQPRTSESADITGAGTSPLPAKRATTSGNCDAPPYTCSGWELLGYTVQEKSTYADARTFFDGLDSRVKPHAYGPFATPMQTFVVVYPQLGFWAQTP